MDRWKVVNRTIDQKSNTWHLVSILGCISLLLNLAGNCFFFLKRLLVSYHLVLRRSALGSPDFRMAFTGAEHLWPSRSRKISVIPSAVYGFTIGWLRSKHTLARWLGIPLRAGPDAPKLPLCPILSFTIESADYYFETTIWE